MELVEKLTLQLHELEDSLEVSQQESNTLKKQVLCSPLPPLLLPSSSPPPPLLPNVLESLSSNTGLHRTSTFNSATCAYMAVHTYPLPPFLSLFLSPLPFPPLSIFLCKKKCIPSPHTPLPLPPSLPQIAIIEQEMVNSQEEVHEVMQALEELAVSYDSKDREIEASHNEKHLLTEELEQLQVGECPSLPPSHPFFLPVLTSSLWRQLSEDTLSLLCNDSVCAPPFHSLGVEGGGGEGGRKGGKRGGLHTHGQGHNIN